MIGNMLEFYDFYLYSIFIYRFFLPIFFPPHIFSSPIVWITITFSASYLAKPLGAIIFGYIGDTLGRKKALTFSLFLSAVPMLIIGIMPSYEQIGIVAPCFIILMRIIQGISFGGEGNGAAIFSIEHLTHSKTRILSGMIGGILSSSANIGVLLAFCMYKSTLYFEDTSWVWRIPFLIGSLIGFIGFYMRLKMDETPEFEDMKKKTFENLSFLQIFNKYPKSFVVGFFMGALVMILPYTSHLLIIDYMLKNSNIQTLHIANFYLCSILTAIIAGPIFGAMSDYVNRRAYFAMAILNIFITTPWIFFLWRENTTSSHVFAHILIGLSHASLVGPCHAFLQRLFPVEVRYRGVSLSYCLGGSMIAGCSSFLIMSLTEKTGNLDIFTFFIWGCALFLLLAVMNLGDINYEPKDEFDEFTGRGKKKFGV